MKRKLLTFCILTLCLVGCNSKNGPIEWSKNFTREYSEVDIEKMKKFLVENKTASYTATNNYGFQLSNNENALAKVDTSVTSYLELAKLVDYNAFYGISDFSCVLNFDFDHNIQTTINNTYWLSELVPGMVGIDGLLEGKDILHIKLYFYEYGCLSVKNEVDGFTQVLGLERLLSKEEQRIETYNDFAYLKNEKNLDVYNSEQLWYGLENGYNIQPVSNSPAEKCLNEGKRILRSIVNDKMSIEQKIMNIHCYCLRNCNYDKNGEVLAADFSTKSNNFNKANNKEGDIVAATLDSFSLEGALFNHQAVCHGFSKLYNFLLNLEGIESYRVTGKPSLYQKNDTRNPISFDGSYYDHSYNYIKYNGEFYMSDLTYAFASTTYTSNDQYKNVFRDLCFLFSKNKHHETYSDFFIDRFQNNVSTNSINALTKLTFKYGGKDYDFVLENGDEVKAYVNYVVSLIPQYVIEGYYCFSLQFETTNQNLVSVMANEFASLGYDFNTYFGHEEISYLKGYYFER